VDESQLIREEDLPLLSVRKQQEAGATSKLSGAASRGRGIDAAPAPGTTAVGVGAEASSVPTSAKVGRYTSMHMQAYIYTCNRV
jgi:hypothetical protein